MDTRRRGMPPYARKVCVMTTRYTEAEFQRDLTKVARENGWVVFHLANAKGNPPGFPDLMLVPTWVNHLPKGVQFWELKVGRGKLSVEQAKYLDCLSKAGSNAHVVTEDDWLWAKNVLVG